MDVRKKKIWMDHKKKKYVWVMLFRTETLMRKYYQKVCPADDGHFDVNGVHRAYTHFEVKDKVTKYEPNTGMVLLSLKNCGAGVVSHEFGHAALWAHKHSASKKQFPLTIKNMKQEEEILHSQSYAVMQFYRWYWKIEKSFK